MSQGIHRKIRSDAVWAEARKAWEDGETARSVAQRYDVGVPALWKRREAEGWTRPDPAASAAPVEPAEGWCRHIQARRDDFHARLEEARVLAECLVKAMRDERLSAAPDWHIPWLYHWRARHLGPDAAARDRARAIEMNQPWAERFWDADGTLKPLPWLDLEMARLDPEAWRVALGLPDGLPEAARRWLA